MSASDPGVRSPGDGDAILLVGVDPESWDVVRRVLEEDGFRVEVAESFASGIARVEPRRSHYWDTIKFDFHWHIELLPRITRVAGFEWGTGFYINPTPPEEAARFLRKV